MEWQGVGEAVGLEEASRSHIETIRKRGRVINYAVGFDLLTLFNLLFSCFFCTAWSTVQSKFTSPIGHFASSSGNWWTTSNSTCSDAFTFVQKSSLPINYIYKEIRLRRKTREFDNLPLRKWILSCLEIFRATEELTVSSLNLYYSRLLPPQTRNPLE